MPNETLLRTLQEARQGLLAERGERLTTVQAHRQRLQNAQENLAHARNQESIAVYADEDLKAAISTLRTNLNGLTGKPRALHERLDRMGGEQLQTCRKRRDLSEVARTRQTELREAETQLAVAETNLKATEKKLAEVDEQIAGLPK